ncbi:hypothetical protein U9M48_014772 [Paspalum notatum var. saurae]|uniref:Uncharacterized protein n=1 Tax=Paspalum notatum var. saurae TaxID=547442 RepID=A0AAQ3WL64_PASNO
MKLTQGEAAVAWAYSVAVGVGVDRMRLPHEETYSRTGAVQVRLAAAGPDLFSSTRTARSDEGDQTTGRVNQRPTKLRRPPRHLGTEP